MTTEPPTLLPAYAFSVTEVNMMWAHTEASIELAVAQRGDRVDLDIVVRRETDPWGGHPEWRWRDRLRARGTVAAGAAPHRVAIALEQPAPITHLEFDATVPVHDVTWSSDGASNGDPLDVDFWQPLFAWGWRRQAAGWHRPLSEAEIEEAVAARKPLCEWPLGEGWPSPPRHRPRFYPGGRFGFPDATSHPLEPGARFEKRSHRRAGRVAVWIVVFAAFDPARIEQELGTAPASDRDAPGWFLSRAGLRPDYLVGWLPGHLEAEADKYVELLGHELIAAGG